MKSKRVSFWVIVFGCVATPMPIHAGAEESAKAAFFEGRERMDEGDYEAACEAFSESQRLDPAPGTLLNLALCEERRERLATAHATYKAAAELAAAEGDEAREATGYDFAERLEPRLSYLELELEGEAPPGLEMEAKGGDFTLSLDEATPVDPGDYRLEAVAPGYRRWSKRVEIEEEGTTELVHIPEVKELGLHLAPDDFGTIDATPGAGEDSVGPVGAGPAFSEHLLRARGPSEADTSAPGARGAERLRIAGLTTLGIGLATTGTGLGFGIRARLQWQRAEEHCDDDLVCTPRGGEFADSADTAANVANVLVGAGAALTFAGFFMWGNSPTADGGAKPSSSAARLSPALGAERAGLSLEGTF